MSKAKFYFLNLLLVLLCFSSCTVEKRIYSSGYHVKWKNDQKVFAEKSKKKDFRTIPTELTTSNEELVVANNIIDDCSKTDKVKVSKAIINPPEVQKKKSVFRLAETHKKEVNKKAFDNRSSIQPTLKKGINTFTNKSVDEPQINTLGLISFISAFFSLMLIGIIPSLLLGAIALKQFKKNPEKYKAKWMPIFGVVIGYIGCGIGILFSFAAAIFGGPAWLILGAIFLATIISSSIIMLN
jgi:hypothetical protein